MQPTAGDECCDVVQSATLAVMVLAENGFLLILGLTGRNAGEQRGGLIGAADSAAAGAES